MIKVLCAGTGGCLDVELVITRKIEVIGRLLKRRRARRNNNL